MIEPLAGTVVVDLSTGIAGAYCTKLLADAGARVVIVDRPDGALFDFLHMSKERVTGDAEELVAAADVVVWSRGSPLTPDAVRQAAPPATVTAITPFGLEGPWADRAATEFTLQAWSGGIVGLGRGSPDRPPFYVGGQIGEWLTGVYAAIGTLVSQSRGGGELVDVSMLETLALCLTYYPVSYFDTVGRPFRTGRSVMTPGVEAAKDGLVGLGVGTGQQWLDFCVMVDHPEWMEDRKLFAQRSHLAPVIAEWMAGRTVDEIIDLARAFRIPHAPIGNGATIPATDHFEARGSIVPNPEHGFVQPGPPYRFTTSATAGTPAELPLDGLRVLDLTAFWAGPLCTHVLAMLGADVVHVESTSRPDGTRLLAGIRFSEPNWWEQSGIFSGLNTNKKSVTIDLSTDAGRDVLRRLIGASDVVVENYTPRVLDQLGFDFDGVKAINPDVVMVRMPGFGLDGPWRDNAAFAFVIEDAAGLTWLTGYPDANPTSPYCVGDANAGLHALTALLLGLEHRRRTGEGVFVEAAMVDAALNVSAEQIIEYSASGTLLERTGNRSPSGALQNLYRTADDDETWVAIAVANDEHEAALRDIAGVTDAQLERWCASRTADEVVEVLWPRGVPVGKVMQPHEQPELEQLQFRGFFEAVEHPVTGSARHSTLPIRFSRGPQRFHARHAPLLGEHNDDVLRGLGLSDDEIAELERDGVIGRVPVTGK